MPDFPDQMTERKGENQDKTKQNKTVVKKEISGQHFSQCFRFLCLSTNHI